MSTAALVLCTTLVTSVGNTSILTKECHLEKPHIVVAEPGSDLPKNVEKSLLETAVETAVEKPAESPVIVAPGAEPDVQTVEPALAPAGNVEQAVSAVPPSLPADGSADTPQEAEAQIPVAAKVQPAKPAVKKSKPAVVKLQRAKQKRVKQATYSTRRNDARSKRRTAVIAAAATTPQRVKKPTVWDRLVQFAKYGYVP